MTVARLKHAIEDLRGDTITNAHLLRIAGNLYPLTSSSPDPSLTNDQKATIICNWIRSHLRTLVRAGAEAITSATLPQSNIEAIKAAADAAAGDM